MRKGINIDDLPYVMTVPEVAKFLRISKSHAYRMCQTGELKHKRFGNTIRINKSDLKRSLGIEDHLDPAI